jgi:hypothetical protein
MAKFSTQGLVIAINNGTAWVNIAGHNGYTTGDPSAEEYDSTTLDSSAKETIYGFTSPGDFSMEGNWDPADAGQLYLRQSAANTCTKPFKVTLPAGCGGNNITFNVALAGFSPGFPKGVATFSAKGKISGAITYA